MAAAVKKFLPLFDRVLIRKAEIVTKTKGGIIIPESVGTKILQGTVVAVGPGGRNQNGQVIPISVKVGDSVVLPEYGGTKVNLEDKDVEYHLYKETELLAKIDDS